MMESEVVMCVTISRNIASVKKTPVQMSWGFFLCGKLGLCVIELMYQ
jgi:hypothetical protein